MQLAIIALSLLTGLAFQLGPRPAAIREWTWRVYFWVVLPPLVLVTFRDVEFDRVLVLAMVAAIAATWTIGLAGSIYARLVSSETDERGALTLAVGWGNTGFLGFPLAQLAFGPAALPLAVL